MLRVFIKMAGARWIGIPISTVARLSITMQLPGAEVSILMIQKVPTVWKYNIATFRKTEVAWARVYS